MNSRKSILGALIGMIVLGVITLSVYWNINRTINSKRGGSRPEKAIAQKALGKTFESRSFVAEVGKKNEGLRLKFISQSTNLTAVQKDSLQSELARLLTVYSDARFESYFNFKSSYGPAQLQVPDLATKSWRASTKEEVEAEWDLKSKFFADMYKKHGQTVSNDFRLRITQYDPEKIEGLFRDTIIAESGLARILESKQISGFGPLPNNFFIYDRTPETVLAEVGRIQWANIAIPCYSSVATKTPGYLAVSFYWDPIRNTWVPYEMISCSPPTLILMF